MDRNPLNPHLMCAKCQKMWRDIPDNPDFSTPEWRAKLMDWATEQEWWGSFVSLWVVIDYCKRNSIANPTQDLVYRDVTRYLWRNLPDLVSEYWEGRK